MKYVLDVNDPKVKKAMDELGLESDQLLTR